MLKTEDLNVRLEWAKTIASTAGEMMLTFATSGDLGVRIKLDKTQVTEADKAINAMVIARVEADFSQDGVLGEEESSHADRERLWVVDPIDDTRGYILGMPSAMFSLALVERGQPVVAVMYEPRLDRMFTAVRGGGAFENGQPIHVSDQKTLQGAQVAISPSYSQVVPRMPFYDSLVVEGVNLVPMNGEAYKGAFTATGFVDAHVFPGRSAHDVAAVQLVVEEAGGRVTNLRGEAETYESPIYGAIASNGYVHDKLVALMKQFGPENYVGR